MVYDPWDLYALSVPGAIIIQVADIIQVTLAIAFAKSISNLYKAEDLEG